MQYSPIEFECLSKAQGRLPTIPAAGSNLCCPKKDYKYSCYYTTQGLFECPAEVDPRPDLTLARQKPEQVQDYLERYRN